MGRRTVRDDAEAGHDDPIAALSLNSQYASCAGNHVSGRDLLRTMAAANQRNTEPYVLDARKCIAYLTIELDGPIPSTLREGVGEWLFGCDICQDVCPWNRKAPAKNDVAFRPRPDLNPADPISLLDLDDAGFEGQFGQSALSRPGRAGILRNAAIVLGNQKDGRAVPALCRSLSDRESLIRGAAAWALGKIGGPIAETALKSRRRVEDNATVSAEIEQALALCPTRSSWE